MDGAGRGAVVGAEKVAGSESSGCVTGAGAFGGAACNSRAVEAADEGIGWWPVGSALEVDKALDTVVATASLTPWPS